MNVTSSKDIIFVIAELDGQFTARISNYQSLGEELKSGYKNGSNRAIWVLKITPELIAKQSFSPEQVVEYLLGSLKDWSATDRLINHMFCTLVVEAFKLGKNIEENGKGEEKKDEISVF